MSRIGTPNRERELKEYINSSIIIHVGNIQATLRLHQSLNEKVDRDEIVSFIQRTHRANKGGVNTSAIDTQLHSYLCVAATKHHVVNFQVNFYQQEWHSYSRQSLTERV